MSKNKTNKKANQDEVPNLDDANVVSEEQKLENVPTYVVTRGGLRVSDQEYVSPDLPEVIAERDFWQKIVNKYPDGTKIEIVLFDKKKHRIW